MYVNLRHKLLLWLVSLKFIKYIFTIRVQTENLFSVIHCVNEIQSHNKVQFTVRVNLYYKFKDKLKAH